MGIGGDLVAPKHLMVNRPVHQVETNALQNIRRIHRVFEQVRLTKVHAGNPSGVLDPTGNVSCPPHERVVGMLKILPLQGGQPVGLEWQHVRGEVKPRSVLLLRNSGGFQEQFVGVQRVLANDATQSGLYGDKVHPANGLPKGVAECCH